MIPSVSFSPFCANFSFNPWIDSEGSSFQIVVVDINSEVKWTVMCFGVDLANGAFGGGRLFGMDVGAVES